MSTVETRSYNEEVRLCFDTSKAVLEKLGYKILRQREIMWLIQASKQMDGRDYIVNITWQALAKTQVTVSCLASEDSPIEIQKNLVSDILTAFDQHLKPCQ
jgi:queuine/archaeosine tRNA-ribosyltransferase